MIGTCLQIRRRLVHSDRMGTMLWHPARHAVHLVKKADAKRVVSALKGLEFFGKRVFSEIADPDRDYAAASGRKAKGKDKDKKTTDRKGRKS